MTTRARRLLAGTVSAVALALAASLAPAQGAPVVPVVPQVTAVPRVIGPEWLGVNSMATQAAFGGRRLSVNGVTSTATWPTDTFGTVRWWDDISISTKWCDVQPTANANVPANLTTRLTPKLDAAAAAGIKRVILVVGPPAPWVFDSGSDRTPLNGFTPWYCSGERSALALPSSAFMGSVNAPGPGWVRYAAYVRTLLEHIRGWAASRGGTLPFEMYLQTANEPNGFLSAASGVPNSATSIDELAQTLIRFDQILRWHMDNVLGLDTAHLKLLTSPVTRHTGFSAAYLNLAESVQTIPYVNYPGGLYDGVSFHSYSTQDGANKIAAPDLAASYGQASGRLGTLLGYLRNGSFPHLESLPVLQTETNQGLAVDALHRGFNAADQHTAAERSMLMSRLVVDGLRWDLSGQVLYTFEDATGMFPTHLYPNANGTLGVDGSQQALLGVRRWLVGQRFQGCTVDANVVVCSLQDPAQPQIIRQIAYLESPGVGNVTVPAPTRLFTPTSSTGTLVPTGTVVPLSMEPLMLDPVAAPFGRVEGVRCNLASGSTTRCASVTITGWSASPNTPNPVRIDVYQTAAPGSLGSKLISAQPAGGASPSLYDVLPAWYNPAGATTSMHRFNVTVPVTSVTPGVTPFYVYAVDPYGVSTNPLLNGTSFTASTTATLPTGLPTAPIVRAITLNDRSVTVSWNPSDGNGSAITGYSVTAAPDGASCWAAATATGLQSCTVRGLVNGKSYTISIAATTQSGESGRTTVVGPVVPRATPGLPQTVNASFTSAGAVVRWQAPASAGGSPILGYRVTASPSGVTCETPNGSTHSCTFAGLPQRTTTFTVTATNAAGVGAGASTTVDVWATALRRGSVAFTSSVSQTVSLGGRRAAIAFVKSLPQGSTVLGLRVVGYSPKGLSVTSTRALALARAAAAARVMRAAGIRLAPVLVAGGAATTTANASVARIIVTVKYRI